MPVLVATNINHAYADKAILSGISLSIEPGERVGLVGRNGAGKSTLIKVLGGKLKPDTGSVSLQAGARAGYLEQDPVLDPRETLRGVAESAYVELHRMHAELNEVFEQMAEADGPALDRLLRKQADLERRIEAAGGFTVDHKIDETLHGLGFTDAQFTLAAASLSGGQRARAALARLLLEQPDVLLLDEPTNHLDIDGRLWLEQYLSREFRGAVVMISHDRYLLDAVVDRIVEVEQARLIDYPGNYSTFRELRAERRESQLRAFEKEQDKFRREEAFIRRYKAGQRAKQARGRLWKLERAKEESTLERPMELSTFGFTLPKPERSGDIVISARGLAKSYAREDGTRKVLFNDLNLSVGRGERWGIVGPNGAGKTTLVRCLLKEIEADAGQVTLGSRVSVGYFRQIQTGFDPDKPVYRHLQDVIAKENPSFALTEQGARDLAGAFLFSGKEQDKEMGLLSGGERARVFLAALLASSKNLLILDEPTNHLDIPSAERLEEALSCDGGYEGTILIISHDRALIDATCDHLLVLDGEGGAQITLGNYSDWVETKSRRQAEAASEAAAKAAIAAEQERKRREATERSARASGAPSARASGAPSAGTSRPSAPSGPAPAATSGAGPASSPAAAPGAAPGAAKKSKFSWMRPEQLEAKMGELEGERVKIEAELAEPETYRDPARIKALGADLDRVRADLADVEAEWLRKNS